MGINTYKVYVKTAENGVITAINSSAFLPDTTGWTEIDEGEGDKYHHAQNNYLPAGLTDENGIYNYKLVDGVVIERTAEEMAPEKKEYEAKVEEARVRRVLEESLMTSLIEGKHDRGFPYIDIVSVGADEISVDVPDSVKFIWVFNRNQDKDNELYVSFKPGLTHDVENGEIEYFPVWGSGCGMLFEVDNWKDETVEHQKLYLSCDVTGKNNNVFIGMAKTSIEARFVKDDICSENFGRLVLS